MDLGAPKAASESARFVADKLSSAAWSWGYCSAVMQQDRRWVVDAHRSDGRRFIVESVELRTACLELEETLL